MRVYIPEIHQINSLELTLQDLYSDCTDLATAAFNRDFRLEDFVSRRYRPRQSIPGMILRISRWCTFFSELLSCQSYIALKSTRQGNISISPSHVLDLET